MNEQAMVIHRFGEPSKQDTAAFGSACLTKMNSQSHTLLYIQLSHITEDPNWHFLGEHKSDMTDQEAIIEIEKVLHPNS